MRLPRAADLLHPTNGLHRLRWILPPVIGLDTACTLGGQPAAFWHDPSVANEGNDLFYHFIVQGPVFFLATSLLYIAVAVLLASWLPRPLALVTVLAYVLGHYLGASTWLLYHWGFGMWIAVTYAIALAGGLVMLGSDVRGTPSTASVIRSVPPS